jgi:hypothetical protein
MTSNPPTQEEWKDLYEAARMFKELAPWKWMEDPDVFGVENPETGETGYCCIMGALGEVLGLLVYLGSEGLALYEGLQSGKITIEDGDLFARQKCLAVTFDDREMLDNKDLGIIKSLGLKFRGRQSWPSFRSHLPGFMPWYLTGAEARFLGLAIRQAMSVAERLREDSSVLTPPQKGVYLVASIATEDDKPVLREKWCKPAAYEAKKVQVSIDQVRSARIKANSRKVDNIWEGDFFYAPFVVEEGEKPFYPYIALYAVHNDHYVLNFFLASHAGFEVEFLENFLAFLENAKVLPKAIMVNKDIAYDFFKPVAESLGISLKKAKNLEAINDTRDALFRNMAMH